MKTHGLEPEYYEDIYQYYRDFKPNKHVQGFGFTAMSLAFESEVHYGDGVDELIEEHLSESGSLILAPNHQSNFDTPTIAGLVKENVFQRIQGNTIIPAKASMFNWPLLGRFWPHMQAHPTFRGNDFDGDEEGKKLRDRVTCELINFNISYLNEGGNVAIFSESHRNKKNPQEVQELKAGIGRIAVGVDKPERLLVTPMGFAYRLPRLHLRPLVVVGEPFSPKDMSQSEVLLQTRQRMQAAATEAFARAA
jgi:hypothetical protein